MVVRNLFLFVESQPPVPIVGQEDGLNFTMLGIPLPLFDVSLGGKPHASDIMIARLALGSISDWSKPKSNSARYRFRWIFPT